MKKLISLILAAFFAISLVSCMSDSSDDRLQQTGETEENKGDAEYTPESDGEDEEENINDSEDTEEKDDEKDTVELKTEDKYVLVKEMRTDADDDSPKEQTEHFYNEYGDLIKDKYLDLEDADYYQDTDYEYNENRELVRVTSSGNGHEFNRDIELFYENGKCVEQKPVNGSGKVVNQYDDRGNLIRKDNYDGSTSMSWITYTYDENGLLLTESREGRSSHNFAYYVYEYDEAGNLVKVTQKTSGGSYSKIEVVSDYVYDANGRKLAKTESRYDFSGDEIELTVTETYEYDAYGNITLLRCDYSNDHTYTDYVIAYEYKLLSEHLNG
ncbi:MAG: hypothetical protein IKL24_03015 [Clostridia bacterium]|nr:hypothetical protein [Clostridia bacterium]